MKHRRLFITLRLALMHAMGPLFIEKKRKQNCRYIPINMRSRICLCAITEQKTQSNQACN
ncbi:hypothetical protein PS898_03323 [Pseudomonas fluorescens]|nr:hypothetical protein PS898_03323 [Pseudomonas fluorescens]